MKPSMEAYKQAIKDIRAELRKEKKSYIRVSLRQLKSRSPESPEVYCSTKDVYLTSYYGIRCSLL